MNSVPTIQQWDADAIRRRSAWRAATVAASSQFLYMFDSSLIAIALPTVAATYPGAPRSMVSWVASAFLVAQSSLLLVGGQLGDERGRKRVFLLGVALFACGAVSTASAPSLAWMIGARALQGAGAAFFSSGALVLVMPLFPAKKVSSLIAVWGAVGSIAAWTTPPVGAYLVAIDWRLGFVAIAALAMVAVAIGYVMLVDTAPAPSAGKHAPLDYLLGPPAFGLAVFVLSRGRIWGWASPLTLGLLVLAAASVWWFTLRCARSQAPLLDLSLFSYRGYRWNLIGSFFQQMGFYGWFLTAPVVLSELWEWSLKQIGFALALSQIAATPGSFLGGRLVQLWGHQIAIMVGAAINVAAMGIAVMTLGTDSHFWTSFAPMAILFGLGSAICGTVTTGASLAAIDTELLGVGNSLSQLVRRMAGAVGVSIGFVLLGESVGDDILAGARLAWGFAGLSHVMLVVTSWVAVPRRQLKSFL